MLKPFSNESDCASLGDLTVANHLDKLSIFGSLDITRDKAGLGLALSLKAIVDGAVKAMEADKNLPDAIEPNIAPAKGASPFA